MLLALTSAGSGSAREDSWRSSGLGGGEKPSPLSSGMDLLTDPTVVLSAVSEKFANLGESAETPLSSTVYEDAGDPATPVNLRATLKRKILYNLNITIVNINIISNGNNSGLVNNIQ